MAQDEPLAAALLHLVVALRDEDPTAVAVDPRRRAVKARVEDAVVVLRGEAEELLGLCERGVCEC